MFRAALALSMLMCLGSAAISPTPALGVTPFVVNKIGDAGDRNIGDGKCDTSTVSGKQCTLRAAIQEANFTTAADTITFNITSSSKVIAPATPLPPITGSLVIDGYSQSGSSENTQFSGNNAVLKIVLDGVNLPAGSVGLDMQATKSAIKGLNIQRFNGSGLVLANTKIALLGNFIGTNVAGSAARGNGTGISIHDENDTIGGVEPEERNVISGNLFDGIAVDAPNIDVGNVISGNYIGTDKTGAVALGNGNDGVFIDDGAETTIGGSGAGARNIISGNGFVGIEMFGTNATGTVVSGNYIGTNAAGTAALPNEEGGVRLQLGNVMVGGDTASERNVISGNGGGGIVTTAPSNFIQGNYIGVDASGLLPLGNEGDGVTVLGSANTVGGATAALRNVISANGGNGVDVDIGNSISVLGNRIGTKADGTGDLGNGLAGVFVVGGNNHTIGGSGGNGNVIHGNAGAGIEIGSYTAGTIISGNAITGNDEEGVVVARANLTIGSNVIVANGGPGILVRDGGGGIRITGNQIIANAGLGIDLAASFPADGVTPNDTDDPDSGGNGLQNYPVVTSAIRSISSNVTLVSGSLNSNVSTQFTIELFFAIADPSGHGEAQVLLATQNITTDSGGDKSFVFHVVGLSPGMQLTATATATSAGKTSEFSANVVVSAGP